MALRHCGSSTSTHSHYSTVAAGPREQEYSAVQSGPGILQSLQKNSHCFGLAFVEKKEAGKLKTTYCHLAELIWYQMQGEHECLRTEQC